MPSNSHKVQRAVSLREVRSSDLETLYEHQRDPEACRMAVFASRDRDAFMVHWAKILVDPTVTARAVVCGSRLAGNVGSFSRDGRRLLGYWIGREFWGRGVASAAVTEFLKIETTRPLRARVAVENFGSIRVLEKCGFVRKAKENSTGPDGEPVEEFMMELT